MSFATVAILLLGIAAPAAASSSEARQQVLTRFLHAPLGFEASEPQAGADYPFFARAPGGDPGRIRLGFAGVESLAVEPDGSLLARAGGGRIRLHKPRAYQLDESGRRREVAAAYRLARRARVAFRLGEYDRRKPLIIDPVLAYSTFLGGLLYDFGLGIAIDAAGNAYVAGYTSSPNFPATAAAQTRPATADTAMPS